MAARTLHALSTSPLFLPLLLLLLSAASSPTKAQQPYVNNHQLDCENRNFDNITNGFTCNGPPSCRSYLTFWSQPPYNTPSSIAGLLNASAAEIRTINNLTSLTTTIPTRDLVVVPVTCSCSGNGGLYQHNATYRLSGRTVETYFSVANDTYQALSTCQAMMSQNPYGERNLTAGLDLLVPLRCACPTQNQTAAGFRYLLTYLVKQGDSVSAIAEMFRSSTAAVSSGNELASDDYIFFFTPLLVPLRTEPTRIVVSPSPTPPVATPPQSPPVSPPGSSSSSRKWIYIGVGIGAGLLLLILILSLYFCLYKRRSKTASSTEQNKFTDSSTKQSLPTTSTTNQWSIDLSKSSDTTSGLRSAIESLTLYRFHELQSATSNFSDENKIKGSVYRATINGDDAAVKVIKGDVSSSEISLLKKLNHSNIIRLSGFCIREGTSYLVYEYTENGSVSDWLHHSSNKKKTLTWRQRVEICRDVAEALDYLHNYVTPPHIHKNLESTNVLLDANFRAKVSNFGVARILDEGDVDLQLTRHVEGAQGYLALEYVENGVITPKLDVFAFGVVVLELLSGKEAVTVDKEKKEEMLLCREINNVLGGENVREKLKEFMDSSLGDDEYPLELAFTMAQLAKSCVAPDINSRPSIAQVLTTLLMIVSSSIDWEPSHDLLHDSGSLGN